MCRDVGYYYEGFDGDGACQRIDEMINSHNDNYQQYLEKNRVAIKRFTGDNPKLVEQYKQLVEDVLNNRFTRRKYDWVTNEVSNL